MVKLRLKFFISMILAIVIGIFTFQTSSNASNENIEIIQKNTSDYIIYVKDYLDKDFQFSFSNNKNESLENLKFKKAETDSSKENANKIAYVNKTTIQLFNKTTYMWIKDEHGKTVVNGIEVNLKDSIKEEELKAISNITKIIPIDIKQTTSSTTDENGKTVTKKIGNVILPKTNGKYEFILVKATESNKYNNLINLITRISKFNVNTNIYEKINTYKTATELIQQFKTNNNNWITLQGNEITQPTDTIDKDEYILWIKEENGNNSKEDIQFLTSYKEENIEKVKEKITTKLPVTYDNNVLLFVLAILVVGAIIISVRIKTLKDKEKKV